MSLTELIAGVEDHEKTLTVFNAGEETIETLREQFHDRNVSVSGEPTSNGATRSSGRGSSPTTGPASMSTSVRS